MAFQQGFGHFLIERSRMENIRFPKLACFHNSCIFSVAVINSERRFSCQQPYFSTVADLLVCVRGVLS